MIFVGNHFFALIALLQDHSLRIELICKLLYSNYYTIQSASQISVGLIWNKVVGMEHPLKVNFPTQLLLDEVANHDILNNENI